MKAKSMNWVSHTNISYFYIILEIDGGFHTTLWTISVDIYFGQQCPFTTLKSYLEGQIFFSRSRSNSISTVYVSPETRHVSNT